MRVIKESLIKQIEIGLGKRKYCLYWWRGFRGCHHSCPLKNVDGTTYCSILFFTFFNEIKSGLYKFQREP